MTIGSLSERVWAFIGRAAALATIVGGLIALVSYFRTDYRLQAAVSTEDVAIPPTVLVGIRELAGKAIRDSLTPRNFAAFRLGVDPTLTAWRFRISNNGRLELPTLTLHVPFHGEYSISQPSGQSSGQLTGKVELGPLRPSDEAVVICWTNTRSVLSSLSDYTIGQMRITHPAGWAKVTKQPRIDGLAANILLFLWKWVVLAFPIYYAIWGLVWLARRVDWPRKSAT